jgi:hypothetical protein
MNWPREYVLDLKERLAPELFQSRAFWQRLFARNPDFHMPGADPGARWRPFAQVFNKF